MLAVALLYSSVGHGGGSGYLAVMALFAVSPAIMKPTALTLNILVAGVASIRFHQAGHFSWRLFWPFAAASVPAAFVGGLLTLPEHAYRVVVGVVLLYASLRLWRGAGTKAGASAGAPPLALALLAGFAIGLVSGLVGIGGGVFLSPLLLLAGWATPHATAAVSAVFILVNSVSGLLGHLSGGVSLPAALPVWAAVVVLGGWLGSSYGSRRMPAPRIRGTLAVVLALAGLKFLFT